MEAVTQQVGVTIKRIDKTLPLPTYATAGSVGFDLLCREDTEIAPHTLGLEAENVIASTGDVLNQPNNVFSQLSNGELPFPSVTLSEKPMIPDIPLPPRLSALELVRGAIKKNGRASMTIRRSKPAETNGRRRVSR